MQAKSPADGPILAPQVIDQQNVLAKANPLSRHNKTGGFRARELIFSMSVAALHQGLCRRRKPGHICSPIVGLIPVPISGWPLEEFPWP